jgi:hypothetical protein
MGDGYSAFSHNDTYSVGSFIYSPARLYFGILESSGNFDVYRGESPDDPSKTLVWSTQSSGKYVAGSMLAITFFYTDYQMQHKIGNQKKMQIHGQIGTKSAYYLWEKPDIGTTDYQHLMQAVVDDDGKFSLRQNNKTLWSNNFSDPVDKYEVDRCDYDRSRVTIATEPGAGNVVDEVFDNTKSRVSEGMTLSRSVATAATHSWSDTIGVKVSVSAKGGASVPLLAKGEITVSTEVSFAYTFGESTTTTETITISLPITVPAGRKYRAYAIIREGSITLPYTMTGTLHFKSGAQVKRTVSGIYTGRNSYTAEGGAEDITDGKPPKAAFVLHQGVWTEVPTASPGG